MSIRTSRMSAHGRFTARPEESYRAALAPIQIQSRKKRSQPAPFSHYVVSIQPTNWAVSIVTRLRCILSSLSNSR